MKLQKIEITNLNTRIDNDGEERVKIMRNLVNEMNTELGKVHELVYFKLKLY